MSSNFRLTRSRLWRTRAATALAAAGALVLSSGLIMLSSSAATAGNDPQPGNNGTVKVGDTGDIDEQRPENDPHLPCTFNIQWFNYDAAWGDITSSVSFELQAPTDDKNGNTMTVSGDTSPTIVSNGGKPGAGDGYDHLEWYTLAFTGDPHPQQGYHVKITVDTPHSQGADVKHKVFWVGPCSVPPPDNEIEVPGQPDVTDPCGPDNNAFVVPADTETLDWTLLPNGDVTVAPKAGYVFEGQSQLVTFHLPADSNQPCPEDEEIAVPGAPGVTDPCGPDNIAFVVPADTDEVDWTLLENGNVTVAPKPGHVFEGESQLITFELPADSNEPCILGEQEIAPEVTFQDPTCAKPNRTTWSGNLTDLVDYTVSGTPGRGRTITVTAGIKPAVADEFAFPEGYDNTFEHSYPTLADLQCVKGTETSRPQPSHEPTVLGTQAVVPTAVDAGIAGAPTSSSGSLLAQLMVAGGLVLLLAGGWVGFGRREYGAHEA